MHAGPDGVPFAASTGLKQADKRMVSRKLLDDLGGPILAAIIHY
jgi:hypothetical protein